jgi:ABC-type transport system substrate-binding protein/DNA-binding SARP family transcriptional activator
VEFRILGPLEVHDQEGELPLGPAKEKAVLAVLLLHAGQVVSRTQLIDGLWGDAPPPTAAKALNVYVSQVRRTLAANGAETIVTRPPGYVLAAAAEALDASRFQRLAAAARERERAGELEAAAALMREALGLWRGPALAGVELEGEGRVDVSRLDELRLAAELDLVDYELALGRHEQLLAEFERLVAQHPFDERLRGQLILALYRSGRQADALQAYRDARVTLVEELGVEPSAALQRLEHGILNHDPSLEAPAGVARAGPRGERGRPTRVRWLAAGAVALAVGVAGGAVAVHAFSAKAHPLRVDADSIGLIDGDRNAVLSQLSFPAGAVGIALGAGSLWLTTTAGALVRADAAHPDRASSLVVSSHPGALALADGSVWMLEPDRGMLDRIDPETQRVVRSTRVGNGPAAIASGFGGLWVPNELDGTLAHVDAASGALRQTIPVGQAPVGVAVGDGSVWVSEAGSDVVARVQPGSGQVVAAIPVGAAPGALAFGLGALWAANRDDGTVSRIDPRSNSVRATIPIGRSADGVAVAGGYVWAISTDDDVLVRIDPATNRVVQPSKLGGAPGLLAARDGRLAVATLAPAAAHRGGTLRLTDSDGDIPATVDPATWWSTTGWGLLAVTNDGLLTVRRTGGSSGLQIVPDLARAKPLIGRDGKTYTFQLRPGIRYSNGRPVRASDVRASVERLWKIHSPAAVTPEFHLGVLGEARCDRAPRHCDLSRGIVTDDASGTVRFRLAHPNPLFQRLLTLVFYDVLPAGTPPRDRRLLPATGPYRFTRFVPGRVVEAERNPMFKVWSTAAQPAGYPDRIVWHIHKTDDGLPTRVLGGRADNTSMTLAQVAPIAERHAAQVRNEPVPWLYYLFLNTRVPPFDNADARRALNLAVDRGRVARLMGGPFVARPTCQILPPSFSGYRARCPYTIDPNPAGTWIAPDLDSARALVRKSGTTGTRIVFWTRSEPDRPEQLAIGRYVVGLLRTLGYHATLQTLPSPGRYYDYVDDARHRVQAGLSGWVPDILDPSGFFELLLTCRQYLPASTKNANLAGYCDRKTDAEILQAENLAPTDPAAANRLWAAIDRRVVAAAPWVPLVTLRWTDIISRRVGNYQYNPMLGFLLDQAWVK